MNGPAAHPSHELDRHERQLLLAVAREAIRRDLIGAGQAPLDPAQQSPALARPGASFVTLRRDGRLLGCIGSIEATVPLIQDVAGNATAAAFRDPRMTAVTEDDFRSMEIDVSVLTPLAPLVVAGPAELRAGLRPGVDGLVVDAPGHRATFLPSVWAQVGGVDEFLTSLWRKAGLAPGDWPADLELRRYQTLEFTDPGPREL